jgi:hypothetical protein
MHDIDMKGLKHRSIISDPVEDPARPSAGWVSEGTSSLLWL